MQKLDHTQKLLVTWNELEPEIVKPLEENLGENLYDIGFSNVFMAMTLKTQATKAKIGKWYKWYNTKLECARTAKKQ